MSPDRLALETSIGAFVNALDRWDLQRRIFKAKERVFVAVPNRIPNQSEIDDLANAQSEQFEWRNAVIREAKSLVPLLMSAGESNLAVAVQDVADAMRPLEGADADAMRPLEGRWSDAEKLRPDVQAKLRVLAIAIRLTPIPASGGTGGGQGVEAD